MAVGKYPSEVKDCRQSTKAANSPQYLSAIFYSIGFIKNTIILFYIQMFLSSSRSLRPAQAEA